MDAAPGPICLCHCSGALPTRVQPVPLALECPCAAKVRRAPGSSWFVCRVCVTAGALPRCRPWHPLTERAAGHWPWAAGLVCTLKVDKAIATVRKILMQQEPQGSVMCRLPPLQRSSFSFPMGSGGAGGGQQHPRRGFCLENLLPAAAGPVFTHLPGKALSSWHGHLESIFLMLVKCHFPLQNPHLPHL